MFNNLPASSQFILVIGFIVVAVLLNSAMRDGNEWGSKASDKTAKPTKKRKRK